VGILVFISQEVIAYVIRRASEGSFKDGLDNNKKSPWNEIVNQTMFNSKKKGAYSDLTMEKKMLLKIQNENLLPKGGGSDQPSLEHMVFLHYFITKEKANLPKYIFKHMIKALRESQTIKRTWIPYGRLISEILHQGRILKALSDTKVFTNQQLDTMTGKIINGSTLRNMNLIKKDVYKKLDIDMKESRAISNLMEEFPPICKQDPLDVQLYFIHDHLTKTRETIHLEDIPEEMYGGTLPVAKSRKLKKRALTEAEYLDDAFEQPSQKAKKAKKEKVSIQVDPAIPTIQEEVTDLAPTKVLSKRTRSGKEAEPSPPQPAQPSIPRRKRRHVVRKLKTALDEEEIEEATELVSRVVRRKKEVDAAMKKTLQLAKEIEILAEVLAKESTVDAAQLGLELTENLQQMVVVDGVLKTANDVQEEAGCSEVVASEAPKGNIDSLHTVAEIVNIKSSTSSDSRSNPASLSTSSSTSSDLDDIPLNRVYTTLNKRLSPSPSTKAQKKPDCDAFVPMYPSIEERYMTCNK